MPRFIHEPWCSPGQHEIADSTYADLTCMSEPHTVNGSSIGWLQQGLEDNEPIVYVDLGSKVPVRLPPETALALAHCFRERPNDLLAALEGLSATAQVEQISGSEEPTGQRV